MQYKISEKYWNTLKPFEQEYIKQRLHEKKDDVSGLKLKINAARKQHPNYISITGQGFIKLPNGKEYLWSGNDTRQFNLLNNNSKHQETMNTITKENYFTSVEKIGVNELPEALKTGHAFVVKATDNGKKMESASDVINKTINLQVQKLDEWKKAQKPKAPATPVDDARLILYRRAFPSVKKNAKGYYIPSSANDEKYILKKFKEQGVKVEHLEFVNDTTDLYDVYLYEEMPERFVLTSGKWSVGDKTENGVIEKIYKQPSGKHQYKFEGDEQIYAERFVIPVKKESGHNPQKRQSVFIVDGKKVDLSKERFPERHPLMILDTDSPQFKEALKEFVDGKKASKAKRPRVEKTKKVGSSGLPVEHISPAVGFIKRFAAMSGKQVSYDKLMALLRSLQKAITEKIIRSADKYSEEIKEIQTFLVARANENVETFAITIGEARLEKFQKIVGSETKMLIVTLLKQYISLVGKKDVKEKAEALLKRIAKYEEKEEITKKDKYYNFLEVAVKRMKEYVSGKERHIKPTIAELNGLAGIGCDCDSALGMIYDINKPLRKTKDRKYTDAKGRGAGSHHGGLKGVSKTDKLKKIVNNLTDEQLADDHAYYHSGDLDKTLYRLKADKKTKEQYKKDLIEKLISRGLVEHYLSEKDMQKGLKGVPASLKAWCEDVAAEKLVELYLPGAEANQIYNQRFAERGQYVVDDATDRHRGKTVSIDLCFGEEDYKAADKKISNNYDAFVKPALDFAEKAGVTFEEVMTYDENHLVMFVFSGKPTKSIGTIYDIKKSLRRTGDKKYTDAKGRGAGSHHGGLKGVGQPWSDNSEYHAKPHIPAKKSMSIEDILAVEHTPIGLEGKWKELIGEACKPMNILMYGKGGSGKSGMALSFSQYLSEKGHPVLYVAGESFGTPVFKQLIIDAGIKGNDKFHIVPDLRGQNLAAYDFIVLDSKDSLKLDIEQFRSLKKNHPKLSFIVLSQGKKDGDYRGSEEWRNEVDTLINFPERGKASTADDNGKNRWGGCAIVQMYEPKKA
jgi:hypothetical protein